MQRIWEKHYPTGVPKEIQPEHFSSVPQILEQSCSRFGDKPAFSNMGHDISYHEIWDLSGDFATYLQNDLGLRKGDRIAIQLPNLLQFPIALFGALRAGLVVVNTNPLYTPREMQHQFKDSGAKAIVILANFADKLQQILPETSIEHVIITEVGDLLPTPKRWLVNLAVKHIKKMVPPYQIRHVTFRTALAKGAKEDFQPTPLFPEDIAFLQYTGGTTGVSKGAILTHRNIVSNMEQISAWMMPKLHEGVESIMTPLPLYHIFSLTVNCLAFVKVGAKVILVTNPRDLPAFIKELKKERPTAMSVVNTLAAALLHHPEFKSVPFDQLKITVAGGMALQTAVAKSWVEQTQSMIVEGYGLTEASPVVSCNPVDGTGKVGSIGLPLPSTDIKIINDQGEELGIGESGELCVHGPQVMKGYWNQPGDTAKTLTEDGWLKTGDIAQIDEEGFLRIVDRKKDMILVSGFNVYPNEIEDVAVTHPKVLEAAAIGIPDPRSGEMVKVFIVLRDHATENEELKKTEEELKAFFRQHLTAYKVPREIQFMKELPKNNVGKILRRELRPH